MRKVQITATIWTLALALPFTVLALLGTAFIIENMSEIILILTNFDQATTVGGRGWVIELAARWPEVAGMIIGQLVILTILIIARNANHVDEAET